MLWGVNETLYQVPLCYMKAEYCEDAVRCPPSSPYQCADLTCQTSLDLCSSVITCPPSIYIIDVLFIAHKRVRNHCVVDIGDFLQRNTDGPFAFKTNGVLCPDYLHWTYDPSFCPSVLTCSKGYVLCDDNTCRESSLDCPVSTPCSHYTCPFGSCVDNYELCYTNIVCKKGYKLCSDRICHPRDEECPSYVDDAHTIALAKGKKVCVTGDIVDRGVFCPEMVGLVV